MALMRTFFKHDEEGFTTVGSAVALLLALALTFGTIQACRVQSRSGQIQYVADAAALAADNVVAELVSYAQVIDASLLTLSLLGLSSYAASAVASFIPGGQSVAARFVDLGSKLFDARDRFAKSAAKGLRAAQKALPALCTYKASKVAEANGALQGASYTVLAIPLPLQTDDVSIKNCDKSEKSLQEMVDKEEEVQKQVKARQTAQEKMERSKEQAWRADCGDAKSMRERAGHLAGLSGSNNPDYSSPETWSFGAAIARAKRYYNARLNQEKQKEGSYADDEDMATAVARKVFYQYALKVASSNKVSTGRQGTEVPHVKALAHGTEEIKKTYLYSQKVYPISVSGGKRTLHASSTCSRCDEGAQGNGSLEELDKGGLTKCPSCKYALSTLVQASQLTGIVESGFEYHYQRFVEAADSYEDAAEEVKKNSGELEEASDSMAGDFEEALKSLAATRIDLKPSGRYGCIVVVFADRQQGGVALPFVKGDADLGCRLAISGACLANDGSVDESAFLQQVGSGLIPSESLAGGLTKAVLGNWGSLLGAYGQGVDGVQDLLAKTLSSIPLVGTDLSESVSSKMSDAIEAIGLEPAKLEAFKPVLTSTTLIAQTDDDVFSRALLKAQEGAKAHAQISSGDIAGALETLGFPSLDDLDCVDGSSLTLCSLSLLASGLGVGDHALTIPFASGVDHVASDALLRLKGRL